jgi:uncharacterized protein (DUF2062 family)
MREDTPAKAEARGREGERATSDGSGLRARLREGWARLKGGELAPWRAAASVAFGPAIGVTPLWGLHLWIVLGACLPLRLDVRIAYLAANVSLPFIAPFVTLAEIQIGAFARSGHVLPIDTDALRAQGAWAFAQDLVLGTVLFAPAVALVGGALIYLLANNWRTSHTPKDALEAALLRAGTRYRGAPGHYVRAKITSDPVVREVAMLGALGEVVDVGCGRGQMLVVLLEAACATRGVGFDWDVAKIEIARAAATGLPATFESGDILVHPINTCDTVLLVDVLHYLTDAEQDELLDRAAAAAGQRIVIRDLDPHRGWRSTVAWVHEAVVTRLGINRGSRINIRPVSAITRVLEGHGFTPSVAPGWGATPFANILIVGTKTAAHAGCGGSRGR